MSSKALQYLFSFSVILGCIGSLSLAFAQPMYERIANGIYIRDRIDVELDLGISVRYWNLIIPPTTISDEISLPAAASLEVRGGEGAVIVGENSTTLAYGDQVAVDGNTPLRFDNSKGTRPLRIFASIYVLLEP